MRRTSCTGKPSTIPPLSAPRELELLPLRIEALSARQTIAKRISRSRNANYFLEPLSAIDPPSPSEIAVTLAGIDFNASICAQAGQAR